MIKRAWPLKGSRDPTTRALSQTATERNGTPGRDRTLSFQDRDIAVASNIHRLHWGEQKCTAFSISSASSSSHSPPSSSSPDPGNRTFDRKEPLMSTKDKTPTTKTDPSPAPPFDAAAEASTSSPAAASRTANDDLSATRKVAEDVKADVKDAAADLATEARDRAKTFADDRADQAKGYASEQIERQADSLRDAGRQYGEDSYQAHAAEYLASNLANAAEILRQKDVGSLTADVTHFARRNPALFLGGAALLGFGIARLLKADDPRQSTRTRRPYDTRFAPPVPAARPQSAVATTDSGPVHNGAYPR
ncbi:MAG: hypothetical protein AAF366_00065 [Pseudomonadota bacterium]